MMNDKAIAVAVVISVVGFLGLVVVAAEYEADRCKKAGGRIISKTSTGFGPALNGTGSMVMTTHNVQFCVSEDGRVLF